MPEQGDQRLIEWLLETGGPVVRWRTAAELSEGTPRPELDRLAKEVLAAPEMQTWLEQLSLGYSPDAAMHDFLLEHLEPCHKIARDQVYEIYTVESELVGLLKAWAGKPIMKQEVMANYLRPYIHDLYVFSHLAKVIPPKVDDLRKVEDLVKYFLDRRFQALHPGYGYAWINERGTYCFPANYLVEREGYYVSGSHMGLGESPRTQAVREKESTFRMLRIKRLNRS